MDGHERPGGRGRREGQVARTSWLAGLCRRCQADFYTKREYGVNAPSDLDIFLRPECGI